MRLTPLLLALGATALLGAPEVAHAADVVPGKVIVRYKAGATRAERAAVQRRTGTRFTRVGAFAQAAVAGDNAKQFSGRIGRKKLTPGSYRATLVATDAANNKSQPKRIAFKVVKP